MNADKPHIYDSNLELFARDNPVEARQLDGVDCSTLKFCYTDEGELNLVEERPEGKRFLYAQEGAYKEAELWAAIPPLGETDILFVFGLGLGYYFFPLKTWLDGDPRRQLVFLEDDPRILRAFLMTEWAEEILNHPQVTIKPLPRITPDDAGWEVLRNTAGKLSLISASLRTNISCLQGYFLYRLPFFHPFAVQWLTAITQGARRVADFIRDPYGRFVNFYANIPYLGTTIPAEKMKGALKGIPAVLCGAGPSLDKQLPQLRYLTDKALLLAPSSSMNPLMGASITPHLGGGIDPTKGQLSRLLARAGNDVPLLYSDFFNHQAFLEWQGPKLHLAKESSYGVSEWFERKLGIGPDETMISGASTSNYLLEAAAFMGCNPIVMVGMDLAFLDKTRYAQGVAIHPTDDRWMRERMKRTDDALMQVTGYGGKEVWTNRHWFNEAACITAFAQRHPELTLLNCTEGGMGVLYVDDMPFGLAVETYLTSSWDIQGWFHGESMRAAAQTHGGSAVEKVIQEWNTSLERCRSFLERLIAGVEENRKREKGRSPPLFGPFSGRAALAQVELENEPAYVHFLEVYGTVYDIIHYFRRRSEAMTSDEQTYKECCYTYAVSRCRYLLGIVAEHLEVMRLGVLGWKNRKQALEKVVEDAIRAGDGIDEGAGVLYDANEGRLRIEDPALGVSLAAEFDPPLIPVEMWPKGGEAPAVEALIGIRSGRRDGQSLYFYPDGSVKAEAYYHEGKLHGPWSYYHPEGHLLARSWFVEGVRQGTSLLYDSAGKVYSRQGYRNGRCEGKQTYYYPDGLLKSVRTYNGGVMDGPDVLFYPDGRVKSEQHFIKGVLHGIERFYDSYGKIYAEANYDNGKPCGISRRWHPNGTVSREVVHSPDGDTIREWDENGRAIDEKGSNGR